MNPSLALTGILSKEFISKISVIGQNVFTNLNLLFIIQVSNSLASYKEFELSFKEKLKISA